MLQFAPDSEEVKSLYNDKPSAEVVQIILKHLSNSNVYNKNDHIVQFTNLLFS